MSASARKQNATVEWTLQEALALIQKLEPNLQQVGFHVALGGSVLYDGLSGKDLDLIILPHWSTDFEDWAPVMDYLRRYFGAHSIQVCNEATSGRIRDSKKVAWIRLPDNRRIDFFFLK